MTKAERDSCNEYLGGLANEFREVNHWCEENFKLQVRVYGVTDDDEGYEMLKKHTQDLKNNLQKLIDQL
jgi:hypothetical protein